MKLVSAGLRRNWSVHCLPEPMVPSSADEVQQYCAKHPRPPYQPTVRFHPNYSPRKTRNPEYRVSEKEMV